MSHAATLHQGTNTGGQARTHGPLNGYRILEVAGIGPGPFCAMMLADMGAEVVRIDRKTPGFLDNGGSVVGRGRRSICLDLKAPGATDVVLDLVEKCDALIEGFRPGVMERLGLGPDVCLGRNPRLVYGRITGWGQEGPLAKAAGHDLNYLALTGALHAMGHKDRPPTPPLHLVGDIGGGAMTLAFGIVCALLEAQRSGEGQVIDAAITDGVSMMATGYHDMLANGRWSDARHDNMLDGGAPFYSCYACADGKFISVGALEPVFYQRLLDLCGLVGHRVEDQWNRAAWPGLRADLESLFAQKTRDEWCALLEGTDACVAPVLDFHEARSHPHHVARSNFVQTAGVPHPAPAPRLSRTPAAAGKLAPAGSCTEELLKEIGRTPGDVDALRRAGAIP